MRSKKYHPECFESRVKDGAVIKLPVSPTVAGNSRNSRGLDTTPSLAPTESP
jgi:hypothetical protein